MSTRLRGALQICRSTLAQPVAAGAHVIGQPNIIGSVAFACPACLRARVPDLSRPCSRARCTVGKPSCTPGERTLFNLPRSKCPISGGSFGVKKARHRSRNLLIFRDGFFDLSLRLFFWPRKKTGVPQGEARKRQIYIQLAQDVQHWRPVRPEPVGIAPGFFVFHG